MLVFAAHVPHSPLLMPSISGDRVGAVHKTHVALEELRDELYALRPDTIVLLSDHPTMYKDAFSLSVADPFHCDLRDVGDLGYRKSYHPDFATIDQLQRDLRKLGEPVTMSTDDRLHFSSAVPLHFLTEQLPGVKLVPIATCQLDEKTHFTFGQALKHTILSSHKRIAVISAGDLSERLEDFSPGGYHKDGARYDELVRALVEQKNSVGLLQLDEALLQHAEETSYRKLLVLFGLLDNIDVTPSILSYESPFGVGLLVANFTLA